MIVLVTGTDVEGTSPLCVAPVSMKKENVS